MLISIQLQQPEFKVQYYVFLGTFAGDRTTYSSQLYNLNALLYLLVVVWQKLKTSTSGQIIWSISFRSEDILSYRWSHFTTPLKQKRDWPILEVPEWDQFIICNVFGEWHSERRQTWSSKRKHIVLSWRNAELQPGRCKIISFLILSLHMAPSQYFLSCCMHVGQVYEL